MDKLSARIIEQRCRLGWSQGRLAEVAGVSLRTVQRIESSGYNCRINTLSALVKVLDMQYIIS